MLENRGSIPCETLHSQDGLNFRDIHFCPIHRTLYMQCISLDQSWRYIMDGAFTPATLDGIPKLSGTTAILLIFQANSRHEWITDIYIGLITCLAESCLYLLDRIPEFIHNIKINLQEAQKALSAGHDPGKRHAFCLLCRTLRVQCPSPLTHHTAWCTPQVM